jgi:hypothetical protein
MFAVDALDPVESFLTIGEPVRNHPIVRHLFGR